MSELRKCVNESDPEDKMVKKNLKELKAIACTNKTHLSFR